MGAPAEAAYGGAFVATRAGSRTATTTGSSEWFHTPVEFDPGEGFEISWAGWEAAAES